MTHDEFITDCSGRKVAFGDKRFSSRCWIGNTADYLAANQAHIIPAARTWDLRGVSILVPIYRSGLGFLPTLESLLTQNWLNPKDVEIILYLNQPPGDIEPETSWSLSFLNGVTHTNSNNLNGWLTRRARLSTEEPSVRVVFEKLEGGLTEVYQRIFTSLIARIRRHVDAQALPTKEEKVEAIDRIMSSTVFAVVDDDLVFRDSDTFQEKLARLRDGKSVIVGDVVVTELHTGFPRWDRPLLNLVNLFFRLKYELGAAVLTPRAALVRDLFHLPELRRDVPYGDQIWFASAVAGKEKLLVPVTTSVVEECYPSNAAMIARLGRFLETGDDLGAIEMFTNLRCQYEDRTTADAYGKYDLERLIAVLPTRDLREIDELAVSLLKKGDGGRPLELDGRASHRS